MVQALWDKPTARIQSVSPVVGAFVEVGLLFPMDLVESETTKVMNAAKALIPGDSGSLALGLHSRPDDGSLSFSFSGNPNLLQELNAVVLEAVLRTGKSFPWSSLQLHRNVRSSTHSDSGIGTALLTVVGQFEGVSSTRAKRFRCAMRPCSLNLRKSIFVRSHSGDRFSLVAFLHPLLFPSAVPPPDVQANLIEAGFKPGVVDLSSRVPPTRVQISAEVAGKPGVVYIGRGHSGLGLPRSPWANPFKVIAGVPRKKVI